MYFGAFCIFFSSIFLTLFVNCSHLNFLVSIGPRREKTCLQGYANNTGVDQPAHPHSLINTLVIRF